MQTSALNIAEMNIEREVPARSRCVEFLFVREQILRWWRRFRAESRPTLENNPSGWMEVDRHVSPLEAETVEHGDNCFLRQLVAKGSTLQTVEVTEDRTIDEA